MDDLNKNSIDTIDARLARIEGQVRGVRKMVADGRDCIEILTQISAIQSGLTRAKNVLVSGKLSDCKDVEEVKKQFQALTKFT